MERTLLLRLLDDPVDARLQVGIGTAKRFFRRQQRDRGAAPRSLFLDVVRGAEFEAVGSVSVKARHGQIIVARKLRHWLAGGEAPVDLGMLEMLTCVTWSHASD
jgi:hypothetical protein